MTCQELVELVSAFLDGELDQVTERRLVDHIAVCDGCGHYVDQFRQTIDALGELPDDTDGTLSAEQRDTLLTEFRRRFQTEGIAEDDFPNRSGKDLRQD